MSQLRPYPAYEYSTTGLPSPSHCFLICTDICGRRETDNALEGDEAMGSGVDIQYDMPPLRSRASMDLK